MAELFADLEFSKVLLAVIIVFLIGFFFFNRITLKQLIIFILLGFAIEHEYLNLRDLPSASVTISGYNSAKSGIEWLKQKIYNSNNN